MYTEQRIKRIEKKREKEGKNLQVNILHYVLQWDFIQHTYQKYNNFTFHNGDYCFSSHPPLLKKILAATLRSEDKESRYESKRDFFTYFT